MQEAATAPAKANGSMTTLHDPTTQLPVKRRCDGQTMTSVYCDSFFSQPTMFVVPLTLFLCQKRFAVVCYTSAIGVFTVFVHSRAVTGVITLMSTIKNDLALATCYN